MDVFTRLVRNRSDGEEAVRTLLRCIGEDLDRDELRDTPRRVYQALLEMTEGYGEDPADILRAQFTEPFDEIVVVTGIPFSSLCQHHVMPFTGTVDVGYLPALPSVHGGKTRVVGLSKLPRLVDCYAKRLQVQERLTREVADAILEHLTPQGVAVVVRAAHSCTACRGVRKPGVEMVTSCMYGVFRDKAEARAEFFSLCRRGG
jgi:GTP cyclohydrolase I